MLLDTASFRQGHTERAAVCIVGGGPAGLTLAQALIGMGIDVIVVEAGPDRFDPASQEHYVGEVRGDDYFDLRDARLRMLGGSSGHWGGICRALSHAVMATPPPNGATGWPFTYDELAPYENAAADVVEIEHGFNDIDLGGGLYRLDLRLSPTIQFGDKYRPLLETAPNARLALESVLVEAELDDDRVTAVRIVSGNAEGAPRTPWRIEADYFVLCCGGIENARLLAWLNERTGREMIANHDLIGRYWMEHPFSVPAHGIIFDEQYSEGVHYFGTQPLAGGSLPYERVNFDWYPMPPLHTRRMLARLLCVAPRLGNSLQNLRGRDQVCGGRFAARAVQIPYEDNRITLGQEQDAFGIPRPVVHWTRRESDRRTVYNATLRLAEAFAESDQGRVLLMNWMDADFETFPGNERSGDYHHMGGTRIAAHPDDGIVDTDLKVHDLDNFYIGGSSVFPTSCDGNPTFSIVQLSLRMADHLAARIAT